MRYKYVVAYHLLGIVRQSDSGQLLLSEPSSALQGKLLAQPEDIPIEVDQASAVASLMLRSLVGMAEEGTPEERLNREVQDIRQRRLKEVGNGAILLVEATGEISDFPVEPQREFGGFVLALCDSPKKEIRARHEPAIYGMHAALALALPHFCGIKKVADQVTFQGQVGRPVFCVSFTGSGRAYVSTSIPQESLADLPRHARVLGKHQSLVDVSRLLARSLMEEDDPLLSFLSAWSGLEIFINKNFKDYEDRVLARLSSGSPPAAPQRIVDRIRSVMSDKYRLSDKFSVISSELDPGATADQLTFDSIKNTRNRLLHGEDVSPSTLPTDQAMRILRKYLLLHLQGTEASQETPSK